MFAKSQSARVPKPHILFSPQIYMELSKYNLVVVQFAKFTARPTSKNINTFTFSRLVSFYYHQVCLKSFNYICQKDDSQCMQINVIELGQTSNFTTILPQSQVVKKVGYNYITDGKGNSSKFHLSTYCNTFFGDTKQQRLIFGSRPCC